MLRRNRPDADPEALTELAKAATRKSLRMIETALDIVGGKRESNIQERFRTSILSIGNLLSGSPGPKSKL